MKLLFVAGKTRQSNKPQERQMHGSAVRKDDSWLGQLMRSNLSINSCDKGLCRPSHTRSKRNTVPSARPCTKGQVTQSHKEEGLLFLFLSCVTLSGSNTGSVLMLGFALELQALRAGTWRQRRSA